jgi:PhnB protein
MGEPMLQLCPYLNFNGQCEEAFKFYESLFGGQVNTMMSYEGSPAAIMAPAGWGKKILHARVTIGDRFLSGADQPPPHYETPKGFSVMIQLANDAEAERIFAALAQGGHVNLAIQKTFWATRFGMVTDRFGIPWMINCSQAV